MYTQSLAPMSPKLPRQRTSQYFAAAPHPHTTIRPFTHHSTSINICVIGLTLLFLACPSVGQQTEEELCNFDAWQVAFDYETDEGLLLREEGCRAAANSLRTAQFGPPTEWELFNVICKGDCRSYGDRLDRLNAASDCICTEFSDNSIRCPPTPTDIVCDLVEFCFDYEAYQESYCQPDSCGRFAESEDDWRQQRVSCGSPAMIQSLYIGVLTLLILFFIWN